VRGYVTVWRTLTVKTKSGGKKEKVSTRILRTSDKAYFSLAQEKESHPFEGGLGRSSKRCKGGREKIDAADKLPCLRVKKEKSGHQRPRRLFMKCEEQERRASRTERVPDSGDT